MQIALNQPLSFHNIGTRENQEDSRYPDIDAPSIEQRLFMVCDGVGGNSGGEVASHTVCKAVESAMEQYNLNTSVFNRDNLELILLEAYNVLTSALTSDNDDMSTTFTFLALHSAGCFAAHIGDSRIYHICPGYGIKYKSEDHSLVNSYVHAGLITPEEAEHHPQKNVITRAMSGLKDDKEITQATTIQITDIRKGDYFFLCSDGVLENISDELLENILSSQKNDYDKMMDIKRICTKSKDNNTAILVPIAEVSGKSIVKDRNIVIDNNIITRNKINNIYPEKYLNKQESRSLNSFMKMLSSLWRKF